MESRISQFLHLPAPIVLTPYATGYTLLKQGDHAHEVFAISRGLVKLTYTSTEGRETVIGLARSGWLIGWNSHILRTRSNVTASTLTPCDVFRIPCTLFQRLIESNADILRIFQRAIALELQDCSHRVMELSCYPAKVRVKRFLTQLAAECQLCPSSDQATGTSEVYLPLKYSEVARLLAITPEHLCRVLTDFEKTGSLKRNGRSITILCRAADSCSLDSVSTGADVRSFLSIGPFKSVGSPNE